MYLGIPILIDICMSIRCLSVSNYLSKESSRIILNSQPRRWQNWVEAIYETMYLISKPADNCCSMASCHAALRQSVLHRVVCSQTAMFSCFSCNCLFDHVCGESGRPLIGVIG